MFGTPVDLSAVDVDSYVVAGLNDHIIPWENAYRSAALLGGAPRFVLSTSGHIQARSSTRRARRAGRATASRTSLPAEPQAFLEQTPTGAGAGGRTTPSGCTRGPGAQAGLPAKLGSRKHKAVAKAPGSYVHAN